MTKLLKNLAQVSGDFGLFEKAIKLKIVVFTFGQFVGKNLATFYSMIWSNWIASSQFSIGITNTQNCLYRLSKTE